MRGRAGEVVVVVVVDADGLLSTSNEHQLTHSRDVGALRGRYRGSAARGAALLRGRYRGSAARGAALRAA